MPNCDAEFDAVHLMIDDDVILHFHVSINPVERPGMLAISEIKSNRMSVRVSKQLIFGYPGRVIYHNFLVLRMSRATSVLFDTIQSPLSSATK